MLVMSFRAEAIRLLNDRQPLQCKDFYYSSVLYHCIFGIRAGKKQIWLRHIWIWQTVKFINQHQVGHVLIILINELKMYRKVCAFVSWLIDSCFLFADKNMSVLYTNNKHFNMQNEATLLTYS